MKCCTPLAILCNSDGREADQCAPPNKLSIVVVALLLRTGDRISSVLCISCTIIPIWSCPVCAGCTWLELSMCRSKKMNTSRTAKGSAEDSFRMPPKMDSCQRPSIDRRKSSSITRFVGKAYIHAQRYTTDASCWHAGWWIYGYCRLNRIGTHTNTHVWGWHAGSSAVCRHESSSATW